LKAATRRSSVASTIGEGVEAVAQGRGELGERKADLTAEGAKQTGERIAGHEAAGVHDADAGAEGLDFLHVVAGVDDGETVGVEAADSFEDVVARLGVDADGGLVEEEEAGAVDEGGAEVQPALHAAGEDGGAVVGAVLEGDGGEDLVDAEGQVAAADAVDFAEKPEIFAGGEVSVDGEVLGDDADEAAGVAVGRVEGFAEEADAARVGGEESGDDRKERGLAGSVGAEEAEHLAGVDREGDAVEGGRGAVILADVGHLQERSGHTTAFSYGRKITVPS
jgi:hypothetical protein